MNCFRKLFTVLLLICFQSVPCTVRGKPKQFAPCENDGRGVYEDISLRSLYVPMKDGVRIALDVVLPKNLPAGRKIPALLMMTRYWRSRPSDDITKRFFARYGYAFVTGDSRGTGASFGIWRYHRNKDERRDFAEIVDWIVAQPWSDGRVAAYGVSYTANTADWIAKANHKAVKAIISRFPDFNPYTDEYFPGGVANSAFGKGWSDMVRAMDFNVPRSAPGGGAQYQIRRVDEDVDGKLLQQAIEQRKQLPEVYEGLRQIVFRDDRPTTWDESMAEWSISEYPRDLERLLVPMYVQASWMDAGTAEGALHRFVALKNPQRTIIGTWFHGGAKDANPFHENPPPPNPSPQTQFQDVRCFLDQHVKGIPNGMGGKLLSYYTMVEEKWNTTRTWPLPGSKKVNWFLSANKTLTTRRPVQNQGSDQYTINFEVSNQKRTRWLPGTLLDPMYPDRAAQDRLLLTYTSQPLTETIEITGHPVVTLYVTSTSADGVFIVYLEDVDPSGKVTYITEGTLRAVHRRISPNPPHAMLIPYHSYRRRDALPLEPGKVAQLHFGLLPTSVVIKQGHSLRASIAGADKGGFERVPDSEVPTVSIFRNKMYGSSIELPVVSK